MGCAGFGFATTRLSFGVARLFLPLFGYIDAYASRGSQMGCAGFGFATLTSRLALRASPSVKLIWLPKIRKKDPQGVLFRIGVARLPKHSLRFVFCPSGLLELRSSQGQNPAVFASLSPDFVELTSSVLLAYPKIHKEPPLRGGSLCIGVARFELTTFCSQSRRSTRLSYTPKCSKYSKDCSKFK